MNWYQWLKVDPSFVLENLLALARQQFWLASVIVFAVLIVVSIYLASTISHAVTQAKAALPHLKRWYVFTPVAFFSAGLALISVALVTYLRGADLPIPSLSNIEPVFGEDQMLQWDLPSQADRFNLLFQVQWSPDPGFSSKSTQDAIWPDTVFPLVAAINETLYWRVRAIKFDPLTHKYERFGAWSKPVRIPQYENVLQKILRTRQLWVAMENEFGRSMFRWYDYEVSEESAPSEQPRHGVAFRGVEMDLAYAVADEACRSLEGQTEDGKVLTCIPSRSLTGTTDRPPVCKEKKCTGIEVRIAPLQWPEVMEAVGKGRYDMAISTITYEAERETKYRILFGTKSYETTSHGVVWRKSDRREDSKGGVITDAAAALQGKTIAVQPETSSHSCLAELQKSLRGNSNKQIFELVKQGGDTLTLQLKQAKQTFQVVTKSRDVVALNLLVQGKGDFDAVATDATFADGWKALYGDKIVVEHTSPDFFGPDAASYCNTQEYRIAVRAGELELRDLADRVIDRLIDSGELARIKQRSDAEFKEYSHRAASRPK